MDSHVDPRGEVVDAHGGIESSEAPARTMGSHPPLASIELPSQLEMGELRPGGGHERASHPEPEDIFAKTMNLMNSKAYQKATPFTSVGLRKRLEMIKNAGVPPLRVVRLSTLIELGCIPRSTEGYACKLNALCIRPGTRTRTIIFTHPYLCSSVTGGLDQQKGFPTEQTTQRQRR